jgi:hypothetical protein
MSDLGRQELERQLLAKLHSAEKLYRATSEEHRAVIEEFGGMKAHPEGAAALHRPAMNEGRALERYSAALKAYTDLVRRCDMQLGGLRVDHF